MFVRHGLDWSLTQGPEKNTLLHTCMDPSTRFHISVCPLMMVYGASASARNSLGQKPVEYHLSRHKLSPMNGGPNAFSEYVAKMQSSFPELAQIPEGDEKNMIVYLLSLKRHENSEHLPLLHFLAKRYVEYSTLGLLLAFVHKFGLDPNVQDQNGNTILHTITQGQLKGRVYEFLEVIELLVKNGADPNIANGQGLIPVCANVLSAQYFESTMDLKEVRCGQGNNLLHMAMKLIKEITRGFDPLQRVVSFLLQKDVDPNLANDDGITPLSIIRGQPFPFMPVLEEMTQYAGLN